MRRIQIALILVAVSFLGITGLLLTLSLSQDDDPSCVTAGSACVAPGTYQTCEQVLEASTDGALQDPEQLITELC